jgi:hypothetical protein
MFPYVRLKVLIFQTTAKLFDIKILLPKWFGRVKLGYTIVLASELQNEIKST